MDTGARHFCFHLRRGFTFVSFSLFSSLLFGHKLLGPLAIGVFTPIVYFFLAISPFLPKFFSFFVDWCPLDSNLPFCVFLCFKLMTSTLIVYLLTIGVLLPPIVIFSVLLCGLASLDSNLPFFFLAFRFFAFRLFASSLFRFWLFASSLLLSCAYQKTISLQVGRKLADKTKDEIMTEVLRVFASLDDKAVQVAYEVRVTFASPEPFRAAKSFSGKHSVFGALSWGVVPVLRACTSSIFLSRKMTDP